MIRSRLSAIALLVAALAVAACSNPTAPTPSPVKPTLQGTFGGSAI